MELKLTGLTALVTGASSGIGRAIAVEFGRAGASVAINFLSNPDDAEAVRVEVEANGGKAITIQADVSDEEQDRQMVERVISEFGRIDILVNNAGMQTEKPFPELDPSEWDKMLAVDLRGVFLVTLYAVREMMKMSGGRIINVTSVHQEIPKPKFVPYSVAKAGVGMMTKALSVELASYNIKVNAIAPGAIATPMNADVLADPEELKRVEGQIPLGRMGKPDEIAAMAVYLASDASDYITGSTFVIDGGLTQQVVEY